MTIPTITLSSKQTAFLNLATDAFGIDPYLPPAYCPILTSEEIDTMVDNGLLRWSDDHGAWFATDIGRRVLKFEAVHG